MFNTKLEAQQEYPFIFWQSLISTLFEMIFKFVKLYETVVNLFVIDISSAEMECPRLYIINEFTYTVTLHWNW